MTISKFKSRAALMGEEKEPEEPVHGGGGDGEKNDAIVIENVDNGYIVRVVSAALEQENVMVYSHEQRDEVLRLLARII